MADERFITGSQSGVVVSATSTSPATKEARCVGSRMTLAAPEPIFWPTLVPLTRTSPFASSRCRSSTSPERPASTVSGLAWTMKSSPSGPSLAHSMSMGVGCPARWL